MKAAGETALGAELKAMIAADGPLGIDAYMTLCLTHPRHGYYMGRDPFGRGGDFITAPEVSQMFGELIGVWCAAAWRMMDAPEAVNLVELGPGRGTLMADMARAAKVMPGLGDALKLHLVEVSPALMAVQQKTLEERRTGGDLAQALRGRAGGAVAGHRQRIPRCPAGAPVRAPGGRVSRTGGGPRRRRCALLRRGGRCRGG